jgi:RNA polymerase sigma factor (sigma-70 family)
VYEERGEVDDEDRLLDAARQGDEQAFAALLDTARTRAWAVCYRICGNRDDAADALQDASVAAWRAIGNFRGDARFSTWFHRIAANASLQLVRRRRDQSWAEVPEEADLDAEGFADRIHESAVLQHALQQLRPEFRTALVLREWGDLPYREIAEWAGVPVQTVKSRLNRARAALARLLEEAS